MRIVFCGTPEFSVKPLEMLVKMGHDVVAVYTQPDRGVGRGRKIKFSAVKECALKYNLPVIQPQSFKNIEDIDQLKSFEPELLIVVAYGLILPQAVLDIPSSGCWNIHASLLPRWRGAAPIHRAILAGDESTGVGIMQMEAGLDTGAVFLQHECQITKEETSQLLHDKLAIMGAHALIECLDLLKQDLLPEPMIQDVAKKTYAHKLEKKESNITWAISADEIDRKIRAFNPWPGVVANIEGEEYKLWGSKVVASKSIESFGQIAKADKNSLHIQCGKNQLQITSIQKPGKQRMDIEQFMSSKTHWYK